jgi:hypothetical protein
VVSVLPAGSEVDGPVALRGLNELVYAQAVWCSSWWLSAPLVPFVNTSWRAMELSRLPVPTTRLWVPG